MLDFDVGDSSLSFGHINLGLLLPRFAGLDITRLTLSRDNFLMINSGAGISIIDLNPLRSLGLFPHTLVVDVDIELTPLTQMPRGDPVLSRTQNM